LVEKAFAQQFFDLNFQCRTAGISAHISLRLTPFGFIACLCPP
jgi:hypothetical protein